MTTTLALSSTATPPSAARDRENHPPTVICCVLRTSVPYTELLTYARIHVKGSYPFSVEVLVDPGLHERYGALHDAPRGPVDGQGDLACASATNLFLVVDDTLVTPGGVSGTLPWTLRGLVVADLTPPAGLGVRAGGTARGAASATEGFLTNALLGVMPLTAVDGLPIGTGAPGLTSLRLRAELKRSIARPPR